MQNFLIEYLISNNYADDYYSCERIIESLSDSFLECLLNEAIDAKYNAAIRTIHRHLSSDPENPANRVNLRKYLEKRRRSVRPGGEFYDNSSRKSSRPVIPTSRKKLSPEERQSRRDEDENIDTRFGEKSQGRYSITRNPRKLRKQRAMGEFD